ncbi:MAG: hypothetical protein KF708_08640 [Pirellulales bacterium]|nr:hypothetical protein [Pirellulales bacterium]
MSITTEPATPRHEASALLGPLDTPEAPQSLDGADIRADARALDPSTEAAAYLAASRLDGVPRLAFWRDSWHGWRAGAYREIPPSEIRADLVRWLAPRCHHLNSRVTTNVLDCLQALALVPGWVDQPSWREDAEPPHPPQWPPGEIMAARNLLVHLPSFLAQREYSIQPTPRFFGAAALDYDFDENAPRPVEWLRFLTSLWPGSQEQSTLLQDWFGYLLTPDTSHQTILVAIGPDRSGKGTIARVARALIGAANVACPTLASLETKFGLGPLLGKSLAIISDARLSPRADGPLVSQRLMSISGEDTLSIDRKNLEPITAKLPTRLMILANELPRLRDNSGSLARRMLLLRMERSFYQQEDRALSAKLFDELPGILMWAIDGWRRLSERGYFVQPDNGYDLINDLDDLASPIRAFIKERCEVHGEGRVTARDLFAAWCAWCAANGRQNCENVQTFGRKLKAALPRLSTICPRASGRRPRTYVGIHLPEDDD